MSKSIGITLTVLPDSELEAANAVEILARAATGIAFGGTTVSFSIHQYDDEEDD